LQDATEKPLAEQSDDEPAKSRPSGEAESRLHDTPARRLVAPEPAEIAEPAHRQREIPLDVAGLAEADAPASPGTHDLPARVDQPRSSPSVTIEQIVIDVHEPPQPPAAQASKAGSAPLTAAAASVIGPLPVRRSTVSLFGMRRR
jgi:hypothetical protein